MKIEQVIRTHLEKRITIKHLEITDTTGKHVHHEQFTGGHHLSTIILSKDFENMALIERHQLVYHALGAMIKKEIHALSIKPYTLEEWKKKS